MYSRYEAGPYGGGEVPLELQSASMNKAPPPSLLTPSASLDTVGTSFERCRDLSPRSGVAEPCACGSLGYAAKSAGRRGCCGCCR